MPPMPEEMALKMHLPYENAEELLYDAMLWVDAALANAYARDAWVGRDPRLRDLMGLVVTREDFERELEHSLSAECFGQGDEAAFIDEMMRARMEMTGDDNVYMRAVRMLGLDETEERSLRLALAPVLDEKYEKLFAYLQDDVTRRRPTLALCARICGQGSAARVMHRMKMRSTLCSLMQPEVWKEGALAPNDTLCEALFGEEKAEEAQQKPWIALHEDQIARIQRMLREKVHAQVLLCGRQGVGRRTALKRASGRGLTVCAPEEIQRGAAQAALSGTVLCVDAQDGLSIEQIKKLPATVYPVFVLAAEEAAAGDGMMKLEFAEPSDEMCEKLFEVHAQALGVKMPKNGAQLLAAKFMFVPGLIHSAMQAAQLRQVSLGRALTMAELHESCYDRLPKAEGLTQKAGAMLSFDDLILPGREKRQLKQAVQQVLLRRQVYEDWGFGASTPYGRGVSILLSGPPGTGKTMAARILARELNMHLMVVQLSQVVSKYIGETEKNLQRVFEQAKLGSQVLFFDECDALFGKRAEVQNAQDRHANAEVAYLLQQMEAHEGVTILATNLSQNIDAAFMRRIKFAVHFPFPDAAAREQLYARMLDKAPTEKGLDLGFMARTFETAGGGIKNIVLRAAFLAAEENARIGMKHLVRAAADEQRKNEIVVVRETLQEYADLLQDI